MYVEGNAEYRKDSADFVKEEGIILYRFDLTREAVRSTFFSIFTTSCQVLILPTGSIHARRKTNYTSSTTTLVEYPKLSYPHT
jgi:hypothetical protein